MTFDFDALVDDAVRELDRPKPSADQPLPRPGAQSVTAAVRALLDEREARGLATYGRSLETHNGRDAVRDLAEELIDGVQYAMQWQLERRDLLDEVARLRAEIERMRAKAGAVDHALRYVDHHLTHGGLYGPWKEPAKQWVRAALLRASTPAEATPAAESEVDRLRARLAELEQGIGGCAMSRADAASLAAVEHELTRAGLPAVELPDAVTAETPLPITASCRVAALAAERDALLAERMRAIKNQILRDDERHRQAIARLTRMQVRRMTEGTR